MKRLWKFIKLAAVGFILLSALVIPDFVYYMPKAKPPQSMTNLQAFFVWKPNPTGAFKVTTTNGTFYQLLGPAGSWFPSGPAAYTFDSRGAFVGWTADSGDYFTPLVVYGSDAIRERITVDEIPVWLKTNSLIAPRSPNP